MELSTVSYVRGDHVQKRQLGGGTCLRDQYSGNIEGWYAVAVFLSQLSVACSLYLCRRGTIAIMSAELESWARAQTIFAIDTIQLGVCIFIF